MTRFRSQVQAGQLLVALAAYLAYPSSKPLLWPMFEWLEVSINPLVWAALFFAVGVTLWRTNNPRVGMVGMGMAAAFFVILGVSAWGALGLNVTVVFCAVKAVHCTWTAIDLKARAQQQKAARRGVA